MISFELIVPERRVLLKPKLQRPVMTSSHCIHSGFTQKSSLPWIPAVLQVYVSVCSSWSATKPSQNNTKPWKPSFILNEYFHLSKLGAILTMVCVYMVWVMCVCTYIQWKLLLFFYNICIYLSSDISNSTSNIPFYLVLYSWQEPRLHFYFSKQISVVYIYMEQ